MWSAHCIYISRTSGGVLFSNAREQAMPGGAQYMSVTEACSGGRAALRCVMSTNVQLTNHVS